MTGLNDRNLVPMSGTAKILPQVVVVMATMVTVEE